MIINDTEALVRKAQLAGQEAAQEKFMLSCEREVKDHVHVSRIQNAEERLGRPLLPDEFERRLARLNPNLFFEVIPENPSHKRLSILDTRGKHFVCVYPNSLIPERSIARLKVIECPDPNVTGSEITRKDFSSDPNALRPGWRRVTVPWGEAKRGWRTVLVRLIQAGLITPTQAEQEFGSDETPEWRQYTGKGEFTSPF
jgi:hypothetical protein